MCWAPRPACSWRMKTIRALSDDQIPLALFVKALFLQTGVDGWYFENGWPQVQQMITNGQGHMIARINGYNKQKLMLEQVLKEGALGGVDVVVKCKKYPEFKKQLKQIEKAYNSDINMSLYSNLDDVQKLGAFELMQRDKVYVAFYGYKMMNLNEDELFRTYLLWISRMDELIRKSLKMRFTIIYFHSMSNTIDTFLFIRDSFKKLPIQYYALLDKIYVVESSFLLRNTGVFEFGRLYKLYSRHLVFVENLKELKKIEEIKKNQIVEALPEILDVDILMEKQKKVEGSKGMVNTPQMKPVPTKQDCLTAHLKDHSFDENKIPIFLIILIETMRKYKDMMQLEGIFRKPGSIEDEEEIIKDLSSMKEIGGLRVPETGVYSGYAVAGVIKKFFTKLHDPIVPYKTYNYIMSLTDLKQEQGVQLVSNIIDSLPVLNRKIILYVVNFIRCEVLQFEENKMNFYNMSIVFNPCFFRSETVSMQDMFNSGRFASILNILFNNYDQIVEKEENRGSKGEKRASQGSKDQSSSLKPLNINF